jgi:hypothetical protein
VFELDYAVKAALEACAISRHQDRLGQLERAGILQPHGRGRPARGSVRRDAVRHQVARPGHAEFERKVFGGEMDHGGNPVARWMIGHCNVRFDENMNYVPAKKRSEDSIDGIVAAVMAEALAMAPAAPQPGLVLL